MKLIELPNGDFINPDAVGSIVSYSDVLLPYEKIMHIHGVKVFSKNGELLSQRGFSMEGNLASYLDATIIRRLAKEYKEAIVQLINGAPEAAERQSRKEAVGV